MTRADESNIDGRWIPPVETSYIEGRSMMEKYDMHFALEHAAIMIYGDRHYRVEIVFGYGMPVQL